MTAVASAAWRLAAGTPRAVGTGALIRRAAQWRAARGELEGAYGLAHLTGDLAAFRDVYAAALAAGEERIVDAVRHRLAVSRCRLNTSG